MKGGDCMRETAIQSEIVRAESRRYFFDVMEKDSGLLLRIKESRMSKGRQYAQTIHIWADDMPAFFVGLLKCLSLFACDELEAAMKSLK